MNRTLTLFLAAGITLLAIPAAFAHDFDIRSDWRQVQRDRARLYADQRACAMNAASLLPQSGARIGLCGTAGSGRRGARSAWSDARSLMYADLSGEFTKTASSSRAIGRICGAMCAAGNRPSE